METGQEWGIRQASRFQEVLDLTAPKREQMIITII